MQNQYLAQLAAEKNEVAAIARERSAAAHKGKMGGGTFAAAGEQRQSNIELGQRQEAVDKGQVLLAERYFNEAVAWRVKELSESVGKKGGLPAGTTMADIQERATFIPIK